MGLHRFCQSSESEVPIFCNSLVRFSQRKSKCLHPLRWRVIILLLFDWCCAWRCFQQKTIRGTQAKCSFCSSCMLWQIQAWQEIIKVNFFTTKAYLFIQILYTNCFVVPRTIKWNKIIWPWDDIEDVKQGKHKLIPYFCIAYDGSCQCEHLEPNIVQIGALLRIGSHFLFWTMTVKVNCHFTIEFNGNLF